MKRQMEQALRESEEKFRTLVEEAAEMLFLHDLEGRVVEVNRAACERTGYTRAELMRMHVWDLDPQARPRGDQKAVWNQLALGAQTEIDTVHRCKDGSTYPAEVRVARISYGGRDYMLALARDITERKRYEEMVEQQAALDRHMAEMHRAQSLGRMAGAIAHHFNNQLQVVIGNLEMAALDDLSARSRECLNESLAAAERAAQVSGLLLAYLGQAHAARHTADLAAICRDALPLIQTLAAGAATVEAELPAAGPAVQVNTEHIRQVLANLMANAWEARPGCVVRLRVAVAAPAAYQADKVLPLDWTPPAIPHAVIEISDDGPGLTPDQLEQLGDPFFTTKFTGRGLGLPVALGLTRAHGGGLLINSRPGQGATFRVCLPLAPDSAPAPAAAPVVGPSPSLRRTTVLVVEDEMANRVLTQHLLESLNYDVLAAANGKQAVEIFAARPGRVDVVLCDLTMPGDDGWATLAALRRQAPNLPVILMSGYDENEARRMAPSDAVRINAFIRKPYRLAGLQAALARCLTPHSD
ncbi:MAG: PAS domain S-box protein [Candidatus Marinimicrobia bacterium]|nr:PAS domain S-box protein [Candidatus Neomarinimicrobiota bacterium]